MVSLTDNFYVNKTTKGKRVVIEKWDCDKYRLYFSGDLNDVCNYEHMCTCISNNDNSGTILKKN